MSTGQYTDRMTTAQVAAQGLALAPGQVWDVYTPTRRIRRVTLVHQGNFRWMARDHRPPCATVLVKGPAFLVRVFPPPGVCDACKEAVPSRGHYNRCMALSVAVYGELVVTAVTCPSDERDIVLLPADSDVNLHDYLTGLGLEDGDRLKIIKLPRK